MRWVVIALLTATSASAEGPEVPEGEESALATSPATVTLSVRVDGLRNDAGRVQFSLYNEDGSIPDEHFQRCLRQEQGSIVDHTASIVFEGLPPGQYAVSILHDENEDGVINRRFIRPIEGVGFSNYSRIGPFNRPNFDGARINVESDANVSVPVIYF